MRATRRSAPRRSQSVLDRKETALPPAASTGLAPVTASEVRAAQALWAARSRRSARRTSTRATSSAPRARRRARCTRAATRTCSSSRPRRARSVPPDGGEAMSYFVGANAVDSGGIAEDGGFAINGGKGWSEVVFDNHQIELNGETAIAMGTYDFTCATTGDVSTVEYTFGYKRCDDGKVRIFLHHSSVPYTAPAPSFGGVSEAEVLEVQKKWAGATQVDLGGAQEEGRLRRRGGRGGGRAVRVRPHRRALQADQGARGHVPPDGGGGDVVPSGPTRSTRASPRTAASRSTAARAGSRRVQEPQDRRSWGTSRSRWARTTSRARRRATCRRSSTRSATSAARTTRSASSSTTRRCRTRRRRRAPAA